MVHKVLQQCFNILGPMLSAPIDLLGSRLMREFKTSELVIEIEPKDVMEEGKSSGLGVGKELLVKIE